MRATLLYKLEKEMVCILKPGFFKRGGIPYGPMFNELVVVEAVYQWPPYPEERYLQLRGYRYPGCASWDFMLYRLVHFAEVLPASAIKELTEVILPYSVWSLLNHAGNEEIGKVNLPFCVKSG